MLTREQRIGVFFVAGLVLLLVAVELTLGLGILHKRYTLYATFPNVDGLNEGADVRLGGLKAGRVTGMHIEDRHVKVKMAVEDGMVIRRDSIAKLEVRALSGDRYVTVSLGTPTVPPVASGDTIEGETPASFSDVIDQLGKVGENISDLAENLKENSQRLLSGLADLVEENRASLGSAAENLASITSKLDRGTGTLGLLLNDPTLYERVTSTMGDVRESVQDLGAVAKNLSEGRGTLGKLITEDGGLYDQMRDTVDHLNATAKNAEEITASISSGEGTLGKAVADDSLYNEAQDTLRTVNRATQSVEDQAAISLLGTIVTSLF